MIDFIIKWCINNRGIVLLLTFFVALGGAWSAKHISVDAIPDLSDVQVVIRTDFPGQAPQIVEDQVTYPLTTAMLAVPQAQVVRGYSMFGTSFVYIIFEDGTDLYWARSRVLEQLNAVSGSLPQNVTPQLGPDATGVGWVYQYALLTGQYCPNHPNGLWHDPNTDTWYASLDELPDDPDIQQRLERYRTFPRRKVVYADRQNNMRYDRPEDAPPERRDALEELVIEPGYSTCPLDNTPLVEPNLDLADLRSIQDWYLRYELTAVDGVSEVAPVGGFVKQYQIVVDPVRLLAFNIPLSKLKNAVKRSNIDVGGRLIEMSETEYMVRGIGYLGSLTEEDIAEAAKKGLRLEDVRTRKVKHQLEKIALGSNAQGTPIYLRDVASVRIGPDIRRGIADYNGLGEVVAATIVMRQGANAQSTIEHVKEKMHTLEEGLPPGVSVAVGYDRSDLIDHAVETLNHTLIEEIIIVAVVITLFLVHLRSAFVAICVLPLGVLITISSMKLIGLNANIMSLGGIAIAIGVMVDSAIIMVENAHKHIEADKLAVEQGKQPTPRAKLIATASSEVGPSLFFALLIITVSFLPVFALGGESGRLFRPLAFTKTFAMAGGAILSITIIPVLMYYFVSHRSLPESWPRARRYGIYALTILLPALILYFVPIEALGSSQHLLALGWFIVAGIMLLPQRMPKEETNPLNIFLHKLYEPFFALVMRFRVLTILLAAALVILTIKPFEKLGSEFMPPLEEGDLLYMPTTDPGISPEKGRELLEQTNKLIMQFPEVKSVLGKIGRAETATDPAPLSMTESTIILHRDKSLWRKVPVAHFYDDWPQWTHKFFAWALPKERTITINDLIYGYEWPDGTHVQGMNEAIQIPGLTNAWTMPIKTRIDMLSTGIKTPIGIKIMGDDLPTLATIANQIAQVIKTSPTTGKYTVSAFPEKSVGGNYLDIDINRDEIARYGLQIADVQNVIMTAMGGMSVTTTVEGLARYPVNIRYPSDLRDNIQGLKQTLVSTPMGAQVPLGQLATINIHKGPPMVKSENARLTSWVFVDIADIDVGTYVRNAQQEIAKTVTLPQGYSLIWSGQYEYMQEAKARLKVVIPIAVVLIVLLLYFATHSWLRVSIVLLAQPFALVGAIWLLYWMDYNLSLAVWVGIIALAGLAAETGLVMLLYLDTSFERFKAEGRMRDPKDLWFAIHDGAVKRIRPKTMTVAAIFAGLLPLLWGTGAGADTMRRLAVPMIGGVFTSFILELLIYPVLFYMAKRITLHKTFKASAH